MQSKVKNFYNNLLIFLFPDRCPYCKRIVEKGEYACDRCKSDIPKVGISQGVMGGYRCAAPLHYHGSFRRAILGFKFFDKKQYANQFAQLMEKEVERSFPDMIFDYITYVPMYKKDEKKRGYNQSELLAKELSNQMGIPYVKTLSKPKKTPHQRNLNANQRRKNLKGAFKLIDKSIVENKSILLLDDIVTTGTTLGECSKTLQKANPSMICCVTLLSTGHLY
ncbi:MAG: ComF family protein [Ruminococcaceae bacterium]|nr:ComF family protein [Oscillospiraceae bacterium]